MSDQKLTREERAVFASIAQGHSLFTEYNSESDWKIATELKAKGLVEFVSLLTGTARVNLTDAGKALRNDMRLASDRESMEAMLSRANIDYVRQHAADADQVDSKGNKLRNGSWRIAVERGYGGFSTQMIFSPEGKLLDVAAWEGASYLLPRKEGDE